MSMTRVTKSQPKPRPRKYDNSFAPEKYRFTQKWGKWVVDFSPFADRHICIDHGLLTGRGADESGSRVDLPVWIPEPEWEGIPIYDKEGSKHTIGSVRSSSILVLKDVDIDWSEHHNGFNIISDQALRKDGTVKHYSLQIEGRPGEKMHHWEDEDGDVILVAYMGYNVGSFGVTAWVGGPLSGVELHEPNRVQEVL